MSLDPVPCSSCGIQINEVSELKRGQTGPNDFVYRRVCIGENVASTESCLLLFSRGCKQDTVLF